MRTFDEGIVFHGVSRVVSLAIDSRVVSLVIDSQIYDPFFRKKNPENSVKIPPGKN